MEEKINRVPDNGNCVGSVAIKDEQKERILQSNNITLPVDGRCGFFVKRKQRYCKMMPAKGNKCCAEHLQFDAQQNENEKRKRIPCPLDPKHSIFKEKLEKHLKKCNATLKTRLPFYVENINLGIKDYVPTSLEKKALHITPVNELRTLIHKLRQMYKHIKHLPVKERNSIHSLLQSELDKEKDSKSLSKHLRQQGSIVSILDDIGSFRDKMNVIEFGAGKGALSHWIQKAMKEKLGCKYYLVDRQHNRNKLDCYHKGEDQGPSFQRLNIDIQHLHLEKVDSLMSNSNSGEILAVGKHLCGGATDLSLRCIFDGHKYVDNETGECTPCKRIKTTTGANCRLHSIVFALCCYHRCTWSTYVGVDYLKQHDITPVEFHRLTKMATWSTCAFCRRSKDEGQSTEEEEVDGSKDKVEKLHVQLRLSASDQEEIGMMCKRIIDEGRLRYIRSHGYSGELVAYTNRDITPENIALIVQRIA